MSIQAHDTTPLLRAELRRGMLWSIRTATSMGAFGQVVVIQHTHYDDGATFDGFLLTPPPPRHVILLSLGAELHRGMLWSIRTANLLWAPSDVR